MPNIHQRLLIGAALEKVYDAITSQEGLSCWWTPGTTAKAEVNSISRFTFEPGYFKEMKITELEPQVKWLCIAGADEWVGTTISFELQVYDKKAHPEMGGQMKQQQSNSITVLTLRHEDWKNYTPMFAECSYTWAQFMNSLKSYCETGKGRPYPNQHRS